jgi:hypothetical protein
MSEVLHVTNGDSTVATMKSTTLGGERLAWRDALHEGPVPRGPDDRLRELRAEFLGECGWESRRKVLESLRRRDRRFAEALARRRHVVLWFEHDLYDQLQLVQILAYAAEADHDPDRLELINVASFEDMTEFHGLGQLTPPQLESLWPLRRAVTAEALELARVAWDAFRLADPTALAALVVGDTSALPFLGAALHRLLEELPDARTGLARSERQVLEALTAGPQTPAQVFAESQEREEARFAGDRWVWRWLAGLAAGGRPLVAADGGVVPVLPPRGDPRRFAGASFALTEAGRAVLAGAADRVELLGIDRWLGGTHLRPGHVWRWDGAARRVVRERGA